MDRLASCYFCGTTLDETVSERPVVPATLAPEEGRQATVVVCRGCDRKLDRVLDVVVQAVDDAATVDAEDDPALADDPGEVLARLSTDADRATTDDPLERDDADTSATESDDSREDAPADDDDAETTVSALEYNKVMRLVQNREFPVDRAEIETVAANAYQISPETCREVIDEAIERDLLAEEDGDIVPK